MPTPANRKQLTVTELFTVDENQKHEQQSASHIEDSDTEVTLRLPNHSSEIYTRAITSAVRNTRPQHVLVNLGGNDPDSSEDIECIISRLVSFASLLKRQFHICTVVILSFMHRSQTRNINITSYNSRVDAANQLLKSYVPQGGMLFWKLKGFTNSVNNIFSDGVHLNSLGQYKLYRQIRGILLLFTRNS